jgi:hypothetical protein
MPTYAGKDQEVIIARRLGLQTQSCYHRGETRCLSFEGVLDLVGKEKECRTYDVKRNESSL